MAPATRRSLRRLCDPCAVTWTAARLLDDGTGAIAAALRPLAEALAAAPSPAAALDWLDQPHIRDLLTCLAAGKLAAHPRGAGWLAPPAGRVLPARSAGQLRRAARRRPAAADFQAGWTAAWRPGRPPARRLLRQFGLWHQLPRDARQGRRRAAAHHRRPVRPQPVHPGPGLPDLDRRPRRPAVRPDPGSTSTPTTPATPPPARRRPRVPGLGRRARPHPRHLDSPRQQPYTGQAITQQRRLDLLRRFATDEAIPVRQPGRRLPDAALRPAAQPHPAAVRRRPVPRRRRPDLAAARRPARPVPAPFATLLHQLAATRHDHVPANHGSDWLFPGRHPGQPAAYRPMAAQLREHGLPLRTARISALRQLVLQVPAPVIAERPRLPPHHHHPPARQGRRTVEPVRRRRPRTLITPGAGPYRPGCGQDRTASRIGPRRNPLRLARATGTRVVGMRGGLGVTLHAQLPGLPVLSRPRAQPVGHPAVHEQPGPRAGIGRVSPGRQLISVMMYPGAS